MPTRRKTATSARRKPKLPDGDEGHNLSSDERQQKLALFLGDFDQEVKCRIELMRKEAKKLCDSIYHCYRMELMKLPKHVREMRRLDFDKAGGVIDAVSQKAADDIVDSMGLTLSSKKIMGSTAQLNQCETILEEEGGESTTKTTTKRKRNAKGKTTRRAAVLADSNLMPPPSTARMTRTTSRRPTSSKFQTPSMRGGPSTAGWETPLVTPKFDPRLPITPGLLRRPKPGERVMSMAGSPLTNASEKTNKILDVIGDVDIESLEAPQDENTRQNLARLQAKLAALLTLPAAK